MYNRDNDLYINVLWTIIEEELIMSMVLGYVSISIVFLVFIYVMGRVMIYEWKEDKNSFMIILSLVVALVIAITGLILKGMGL